MKSEEKELEFYLHAYEQEEKLIDKVRAYFESGQGADVTKLVIGCWENAESQSPQEVVDYIIERREQLPNLKVLSIARVDIDDCEISWIELCDLGPLVMAFPQLERLNIMGSRKLRLSRLNHKSLKQLFLVCGGLPKVVIEDIASARLPALEEMNLYLGMKRYGFDAAVEDLKPLMERGRFPALNTLGLLNSDITDEIAIAIADASILDQLETLALAMGTLSDRGAEALLASERIRQLKTLDIGHHYMSEKMMAKMEGLEFVQGIWESEGDDFIFDGDDYRQPDVTGLDSLFVDEME